MVCAAGWELKINTYPVRSKYILVMIILFILLIFRIIYEPDKFADYDLYHNIVEDLVGSSDVGPYEWASYKTFQIIANTFVDSTDAIRWIYFLNFFIFSVAIVFATKFTQDSAGGLLLAVAMFAPLLAFVTLRATPAYLLVLCAVLLTGNNQKRISSVFALIAILYHISAVIPAIVVIFINFKKIKSENFLKCLSMMVYLIAGVNFLSFFTETNLLPSMIGDVISNFKYIDKYNAYADNSQGFSVIHYLYLALSVGLFFLMQSSRSCFKQELYVYFHIMMLIYCIMMLSPVAAFRISIFYLLPMIILMPWRLIFGRFSFVFYCGLPPLLFIYLFSGVLVK